LERRTFIRGTFLGAAAFLAGCKDRQRLAQARPNVLVIFTDDQGMNDVSAYNGDIPTPHMDSIGERGIRFTQHYAAAPACTPSRFSLLTGCYPQRSLHSLDEVIMPGDTFHLDPRETTLATRLKSVGYRTALIGKWHLGSARPEDLPMHHGFDRFTGISGGCIDYWNHSYGPDPDWYIDNKEAVEEGYATDLLTDHALTFFDEQRESTQPFFLYLSYNAPHYAKSTRDSLPENTLRVSEFKHNSLVAYNTLQAPKAYLEKFSHIKDEARRYYAATVANLDDNIGRVLDRLKRNMQLDNTLVWLISDNGADPQYGGSNLPFRGNKQDLFEGGIRIPAMLMWKSRVKPLQIINQPLHNVDILPTLATICGFTTTGRPVDGIDAGEIIFSNRRFSRKMFWQWGNKGAFREGDWKYITEPKRHMLYNIKEDSLENRDLADLYPDKVSILQKLYADKYSECKIR